MNSIIGVICNGAALGIIFGWGIYGVITDSHKTALYALILVAVNAFYLGINLMGLLYGSN